MVPTRPVPHDIRTTGRGQASRAALESAMKKVWVRVEASGRVLGGMGTTFSFSTSHFPPRAT